MLKSNSIASIFFREDSIKVIAYGSELFLQVSDQLCRPLLLREKDFISVLLFLSVVLTVTKIDSHRKRFI